MVSTFTPNVQLEEPARGDQVGVWDTPVNSNMTVVDRVVGAITTISLNNAPVVLAAAQYQSKTLIFNSTLTGNVAITFPTSFTKSYEILNNCTGTASFIVALGTTAAGGQAICVPPGDMVECFNDGTNLKYKNLGRVGSYMDYAGIAVPNWIASCTVPPYLLCNGTAFSAVTYPALAQVLPSLVTPDSLGRARFGYNNGTSRITTAVSGMDGNTLFAGGGDQSMPTHLHGLTDNGHTHLLNNGSPTYVGQSLANYAAGGGLNTPTQAIDIHVTGINQTAGYAVQAAGAGVAANMPPGYIGGLTFIRAA